MLRRVALVRTDVSEDLTRATRRNIPEDAILHSHRRENLKSYISMTYLEAILLVHTVLMELNLSRLPDEAIHVSAFCGEGAGVVYLMLCPKFILCFSTADLKGCSRRK
jgi:hypothetical protein